MASPSESAGKTAQRQAPEFLTDKGSSLQAYSPLNKLGPKQVGWKHAASNLGCQICQMLPVTDSYLMEGHLAPIHDTRKDEALE